MSRPAPSTSPSSGSWSRAMAEAIGHLDRQPGRRPPPAGVRGVRQRRRGLRAASAVPARDVVVRCRAAPGSVEVEVHDEAGGFDPDDLVPHPPVDAPERLHHERGLGVPLMRELAEARVPARGRRHDRPARRRDERAASEHPAARAAGRRRSPTSCWRCTASPPSCSTRCARWFDVPDDGRRSTSPPSTPRSASSATR